MTNVIDELVAAMNAHDLDAATRLIHEEYQSEQPLHPGRAFVGRAQMRANWAAMFEGIPNFHAEVRRSVQDGDTTWTEWQWSGTRGDSQPFEMRGVTLFQVATVRSSPAGSTWMKSKPKSEASNTLSRTYPAVGRTIDRCAGP